MSADDDDGSVDLSDIYKDEKKKEVASTVINGDIATATTTIISSNRGREEIDVEAGDDADEKLTFRHVLLIIEMIFITLSSSYTEMCIVPALPIITEEWGSPSTVAFIPWVLSAFNIVGTVATSLLGYLASIYGPKYPAVFSFAMYAIGQIGCSLSGNIFTLVAFRAVQGFGLTVYALFDSVVNIAFPRKYVPLIIGIVSTNNPVGTVLGLLGGSATLDALSRWQDMFWTTLPFPIIFGLGFVFTFKDSVNKKGSVMNDGSKRPPFDWFGPILLTFGLVMFLFSFTLYDTHGFDWLVITFFFVGLALMAAFCVYELRVEYPLIPMRLFKGDILILMIISTVLGISVMGVMQIFPYMLLSPENEAIETKKMIYIGLVMLPLGAIELFISPVAGLIGERVGFSLCIIIGAFIEAFALTLLTFFHYTLAQVLVCLIIYGGSFSLIYVSMANILMKSVPPYEFSIISGTSMLTNIMGGSIGPILADLISRTSMYYGPSQSSETSSLTVPVFASDKGYKMALLFLAIVTILAFGLTFFLTNKLSACRGYKKIRVKSAKEGPVNESTGLISK